MLDNIIRASVQHKLLVWIFVCALVGCGLFAFSRLSVDAVPDITNNQVQIVTNSSNLACQEVEQFITAPLEKALATLPKKEEIRSISRFGLSSITVVFEEDVDIDLARRWVEERLKTVIDAEIIPAQYGRPELAPVTTGLGEIYQYVLYAEPAYDSIYTPTELRTLQEWLVKRQLANVKGVIEVNSIGGFLKQYEISIYPDKMKSLGVSIEEIITALSKNNANSGGSYIEKGNYSYFIRTEGLLQTIPAIENIAIKTVETAPILIKDVAKVRIGASPRMGAVTMSGLKNEVVAGQVLMLKGSSSAEVIARVKAQIEIIKTQLPKGVKLESYLDRSKLVQKTFSTVQTNLIEGGLIVIFMLMLFLGNWRAGLIVASVIPLAMLFAISMMYVFGISANLMSLGAIDFGLVVDGAVIIVESILHRLHHQHANQRLNQKQMDELVADTSVKIRETAAFGEIIILIVYLPILALVGIEGKMFKPMAQTVGFAILGALILSLTYVPMVTALFLNKFNTDKATFSDKLVAFIERLYLPLLKLVLQFKYVLLVAALSLLGFSLWIFSRMGGEFIPTLEEGDFAIHQILPVGSSLSKSVEVSHELQDILTKNFPEVEKIVTKIGTAEIPTDIMPWEGADIFVSLKDQSEWTSAANREELFAKMEEKLNQFPGVFYEFSQPIQMRFNELMTGVRQDIAVKIYGEDLSILLQLGEQAQAIINPITGVGEMQLERTAGLQQIVVRPYPEKLRQYNLTIEDINFTVQTAFAGTVVGAIFEGEKRFELAVRLAPELRQDISNVQQLYVTNANGVQIPLQELAEVRYEDAPMQISRDNAQRRIVLGINARNRDVESLVKDIQTQLNQSLKLPTGYYLTYGGQFENLQQAKARLFIAVPIALVLILLLLYLTFGSVGQAVLIFAAVPMSAIGGILALWARGLPFSVSAGVGFIALFGVAVLNGIVLIGAFNTLKKETNLPLLERIYTATCLRLRAVVMTASVAGFGFLPMAISSTAGAEVQRPLATVVIGGLLSATFLTLFLLPVLYYLYEKMTAKWTIPTAAPVLIMFGLFIAQSGSAQSLPVLWQKAKTDNLLPQQARNVAAQHRTLANGAQQHPTATFYLNHEAFKFNDFNNGMYNLYAQQNFNLPQVANSYRAWQNNMAQTAELSALVVQNELKLSLATYYADCVEANMWMQQLKGWDLVYAQWEKIAQAQYNAGLTTKLPLLQAQSQRELLKLQSQQYQQKAAIAISHLEYVSRQEKISITDSILLNVCASLDSTFRDTIDNELLQNHLLAKYAFQQIATNTARQKNVESQLLPQIYTQVQLQVLDKQAMYYGAAIGVTMPIFTQNVKAQVAQIQQQSEGLKLNLEWNLQTIANQLITTAQELQRLQMALDTYSQTLIPLAEQQLLLALKSYQNGETDYLYFLQSTQQLFTQQSNYWQLQREYVQQRILWDYYLMKNE